MDSELYEFDVWYVKETDYGNKESFCCTIKVLPEANIQDVRRDIKDKIGIYQQINLLLYSTQAFRKVGQGSGNVSPRSNYSTTSAAPYLTLVSTIPYTNAQVVQKIPSKYPPQDKLNDIYDLEPLPRMKIVAILP